MFHAIKKRKRLSVYIFFLLIPVSFGQLQFEHFTIENGLSNNSIRHILQDKQGFLWFGTLNGLNRFDGKKIKTYTFEPGNLHSLSSNRIVSIYEDQYNYLWITTFENHFLRFDPRTEKFININYLTNNFNIPLSGPAQFTESSPGKLWISPNGQGLMKIRENRDDENLMISIYDTMEIIKDNTIHFIYADKKKNIWIGTENGLLYVDNDSVELNKSNIHCYLCNEEKISFSYVYESTLGLLLTTSSNGIYTPESGKLVPWKEELKINSSVKDICEGIHHDFIILTDRQGFFYIPSSGIGFNNYSINTNINDKFLTQYYSVYQDKWGLFWLVSPKRGITLFDPVKKETVYFGLNSQYRESPGDPDKQIILEDSNGDLWVGLYGGGLCRYKRNEMQFDHFYNTKNNPFSLSSNFILSMLEDSSKNIWIGTFQGGLNKLELTNFNFNYYEPVKNASFNTENEIRSILEDQYKRLWVGTREGHIFCYNEKMQIIFKIPEDLKTYNQSYVKRNVYAMLEDDHGNLWIGTKGEGLMCIKGILNSRELKNIPFQLSKYLSDNSSKSISFNDIFALHKDYLGQIWIGTYNEGIDIIENPGKEIVFKNISHTPNVANSLSDNRIRCFYEDKDHNMWIGTSYGLNFLPAKYLDNSVKKFKKYLNNPSDKHSLSNNDVFYIHQDQKGQIWVATYGGGLNLLYEDPETGEQKFKHFFRKDGLPSDVIFSILEDMHNNLWLSTDNGLCKFSDEGRQIERYVAKEGLGDNFYSEGTCVKACNGDFVFGQKGGFVRFNPESIKRDEKEYPLVLTGFNIFDQNVVPGLKNSPLKKSIETTKEIVLKYNQNFISIEFAVLDFKSPEKINYSFILENFEEKWNNVSGQNRAVYRGLSPGKYIFKVTSTNSNGVWMNKHRTLKINILPPFWKTKLAYFIYILLIVLLTWLIIYFVSKEIKIRNEIKYEKRLTEDKLMFYTNISHEFKTPLTLINSSTEDLLESTSLTDENRKKVDLIKKNSTRLQNLIEQLLDFRRIQKGRMELKARKIEIISFLNDLYLTFLPLSEKKNIEFLLNTNVKKYEGWLDPKHVEKIVINLLSNAFKHTPEKKRIVLDINMNTSEERLTIKVIDYGEGIENEKLQKIFDRFAFIDKDIYSQFKGSGIGLSLSRDLTNLHKGNITVESELHKGSTFTVDLPVGYHHYEEHEKEVSETTNITHQVLPFQLDLEESPDDNEDIINKTSSAIKSQILVVEDNDELRQYMAEKLKKIFIVNIAHDGEEGLKIANEMNLDLIISDVKMPKMDGLEMTRHIKNNFNTSHIPVVLLTAKSSIEHQIEGLDFGADDYITKPFNMTYLQKRILNIINQRKILKEKFSQDPGFKPEKLTVSTKDQKFLAEVIRLVEENLKTPNYSIENIIEEMGFSRTVFYKKMKGISGYAPKEFIRIVKMKKAAALLREPDSSISQVSYDVGYNDPDYFSKSFKNYFGEPPSEYQKKFR